jgi:tetratricopeptide (TPR) repeat protein
MAPDAAGSDALVAARAAYAERRYADACRAYAAIVAADGRSLPGWTGLGDARWKRGDRDGAIEAYERASRCAPNDSRAWHNLATALLAARRFGPAAQAATRSVGLDPSRAKAWNNLAAAREALGDPGGAEAALLRAVEADPEFSAAWENLGWLRVEAGRCAEAEGAFTRAAVVGRFDPSVERGLARCLADRGDLAGAEARLAEAVRASPSRVDLWLDLGDLRRKRANPSAALEAYEAALGAAEEMGAGARASVGRRAFDTALAIAREAVASGDRRALVAALDRACAVREQAGLPVENGEASGPGSLVEAARAAARADMSPADVSALVRSRLRTSPTGGPGTGGA